MKKFISIVLSIALVACMFGMSVMAAESITIKDNEKTSVVGNGVNSTTNNGTVTDGADSPDGKAEAEISITVGALNHKYAVDIEFSSGKFAFNAGEITWNVDEKEYQFVDEDGNADLTKDLLDTEYEIKIYNHSDMPVSATATINQSEDSKNMGIKFELTNMTATVSAVSVGAAEATSGTVSAKMFADNWDTVAKNLLIAKNNDLINENFIAGTITVQIGKVS